MKKDHKTLLLKILIWSFPPPLIALVCAIAMHRGEAHPWISYALITGVFLSLIAIVYGSGLCSVIFKQLDQNKRELDTVNQSYTSLRTLHDQLVQTMENLSAMREIMMSANLEKFSELLQNFFNLTHTKTGARSLTIFLESHQGLGAFPKAHMHWGQEQSSLPGELFLFFDEEIPYLREQRDRKFSTDHLVESSSPRGEEISGHLHVDGKISGTLSYLPPFHSKNSDEEHQKLIEYIEGFELICDGVLECWESRRHLDLQHQNSAYICVPILSQGLTIGVLSAEFPIEGDPDTFWKVLRSQHIDTLKDYGRNIGQPLKKEELYVMATTDGLTGLFNKVHYETLLGDTFHRMVRYERDLSFIFADIDKFKNVNDTHGHLVGDEVLKGVSRIIRENIRQSDMAFRIGGEELCILLAETPLHQAVGVAEKLRQLIEDAQFPLPNNEVLRVTCSFGVSHLTPDIEEPKQLVAKADKEVYRAKHEGRNRVCPNMQELEAQEILSGETV